MDRARRDPALRVRSRRHAARRGVLLQGIDLKGSRGSIAKPALQFHAVYGSHEATIRIESGEVEGHLPPRTLAHVQEWRCLHRSELLRSWELAAALLPLPRIAPLE
ncbi:MAG: DUF4160 domain-containing protein [Steroidobacteraceae bacterium]